MRIVFLLSLAGFFAPALADDTEYVVCVPWGHIFNPLRMAIPPQFANVMQVLDAHITEIEQAFSTFRIKGLPPDVIRLLGGVGVHVSPNHNLSLTGGWFGSHTVTPFADGGDAAPVTEGWNLRAIAGATEYYAPENQGDGVDVYVLDTGIFVEHPDFEGRAVQGTTYINNVLTDVQGHGTHVAGIVGSKTYGVARKARMINVRVLDDQGTGSVANIALGINWVIEQVSRTKRPSVINLSLGSQPNNENLDFAIQKAYEAGIPIAIAAGNENIDACQTTPANSPYGYTVSSSNVDNTISSFSNYGSCSDIFAPGNKITSLSNQGGTKIMSGTSMASPHVAGVMALILGAQPRSTVEVYQYLSSKAFQNTMRGDLKGVPDRLVFNGRTQSCDTNTRLCNGLN